MSKDSQSTDKGKGTLQREAFTTSRELDFLSVKELTAQIGHSRAAWPLVLVKELVDNSLDACEEATIAPEVSITVDDRGLTVTDNGPGIASDVVERLLDFSVRVSSREAYVAPDRGDQGNALKTVVAMPFVIDGERGQVTINSQGVRHEITLAIDHIRQTPVITHDKHQDDRFVKNGTSVTVELPRSFFDDEGQDLQESDYDGDEDLPRSLLSPKERFLQIADDFTFLNPHVSLTCDWYGERIEGQATNAEWSKWRPSDPTSAHWYTDEHLARLVSAHLSHGKYSTVRELVADFRGLSSTAKQKRVLATAGLTRAPLEGLINGDGKSLDRPLLEKLLSAMREESKPVKPAALGVIGREHLETKFESLGCEMESFNYKKVAGDTDGIPWIVETAFGWCDDAKRRRRIVTGVNWSPGIINPFRELGTYGRSLDTVLSQQRATAEEPIVFLLHMACPRVQFADRGKSSVIVEN